MAINLTDTQWERIRRSVQPHGTRTGLRDDDRRTISAILYMLQTGCRWQDLPLTYGSPVICWRRLSHWQTDGTWEQIWRALLPTLDAHDRQAWIMALLNGRFVPAIPRKHYVETPIMVTD